MGGGFLLGGERRQGSEKISFCRQCRGGELFRPKEDFRRRKVRGGGIQEERELVELDWGRGGTNRRSLTLAFPGKNFEKGLKTGHQFFLRHCATDVRPMRRFVANLGRGSWIYQRRGNQTGEGKKEKRSNLPQGEAGGGKGDQTGGKTRQMGAEKEG